MQSQFAQFTGGESWGPLQNATERAADARAPLEGRG